MWRPTFFTAHKSHKHGDDLVFDKIVRRVQIMKTDEWMFAQNAVVHVWLSLWTEVLQQVDLGEHVLVPIGYILLKQSLDLKIIDLHKCLIGQRINIPNILGLSHIIKVLHILCLNKPNRLAIKSMIILLIVSRLDITGNNIMHFFSILV